MIMLSHGHSEKDTWKGRVDDSRGNSFNKGMKAVKVENG